MNSLCACDNCEPVHYVDDFGVGKCICLKCNNTLSFIYQQIKEEEVGYFTKKLIELAKKAMSK